jgi:hypothetical protein
MIVKRAWEPATAWEDPIGRRSGNQCSISLGIARAGKFHWRSNIGNLRHQPETLTEALEGRIVVRVELMGENVVGICEPMCREPESDDSC